MHTIKPTVITALLVSALMLTACVNDTAENQDTGENLDTMVNLVVNPGFEELNENQRPVAWKLGRHVGELAYRFDLDDEVAHSGAHSYRIEQYADQVYGVVKQSIVLPEGHGDTFTVTAMLKTHEIEAGKGWQLYVNSESESGRVTGQFKANSINGTTDWQRITIEEVIPSGTAKLAVGVLLQSKGTGWVDDVSLSVN